jgi:hypothetical protein
VKLDWGCGCCCANNVWGGGEIDPLLNMDIPGEIARTIANITQRDGCSIESILLLNDVCYEAAIFRCVKMRNGDKILYSPMAYP